jgi:hypothetical protein
VAEQRAEVEGGGGGGIAAVGDGADAGEDRLDGGIRDLGVGSSDLKEEADDGQGVV